ncbi:MAG TPA: molybdopterin-dependent oxidoreductase [Ignavibacteriaceae bacterium]|nr:molybdopterin-dependent oxidoreductase [Ignavibacteriaceae bacterium]
MEINRRDFVKLIGTSLAGLAIGSGVGAIVKIPESMSPLLYSGPRVETWTLTSCSKCPGGCSLKVRLIDKFPIQAFGNPLSPVNDGGICSMGLASISDLYHPSRITGPLKKVNDKFVPITYGEAYGILLDNLKSITKENKQNDIFIIAQTESRIRADILKNFSEVTGINNLIIDNYHRNSIAPYNDIAAESPDFIDFENCDYLLTFGTQLTEISPNPLYFARKLNEFRDKGFQITNAGSKLISSSSILDEWIPVQPSAFGDLALGIAYVLLKDGQYDKNAETLITDFNSIKKYILDNYYPDNVEKSTGVPADTILETGRKFEKASAPAAYFDESILYTSNGTENAYAIITLNALKGFNGYGKIKDEFYSKIINDNAVSENITFSTFKKRLTDKNDIKTLIISGSNFIFNNTDQETLKKQISSIPFIVSFSPFIDESSIFAHLIIPDHNELEKLDLHFDESIGESVITVQQPVVEPFYKTIDTGDVFISLIKDLKPESKFLFGSITDYLKSIADKLYKNGDGTLMSQNKFTEIEKGLRKIGWKTDQYGSFDDFWDSLLEYGGWWNPFGERKSYSPKINLSGRLSTRNIAGNTLDRTASKNNYYLNIFRKNLDYKGSMSLFPVLVEQFGHNWSIFYELWMEINPETARSHSLRDRSKVFIKTVKGKFPAVVIYNPAVMPGNLDVPFGLGHNISGDNSGINPLVFTDNIFDKVSGKPSFTETTAEIEPVSGNSFFSANTLN